MCTLTWHLQEKGYTLFFNRDELKSRQSALPPRLRMHQGVSLLAPQDQDAGGTWIAVNPWGVTTCLLNAYPKGVTLDRRGKRSRGLLVLDAAVAPDAKALDVIADLMDWSEYMPFNCFQFYPDRTVRNICWDGTQGNLRWVEATEQPQSGSSYRNDEVVNARVQSYRQTMQVEMGEAERLEKLWALHSQHDRDHGAYSINMCRPDAQTVSFSRVQVGVGGIDYIYREKQDDGVQFGPEMRFSHACQ
jgi:hypothetical protein